MQCKYSLPDAARTAVVAADVASGFAGYNNATPRVDLAVTLQVMQLRLALLLLLQMRRGYRKL